MTSAVGEKLNFLSASEASRLIRAGEISATELLQDCFDQIHRLDAELKAWVHLNPNISFAEARAIDEKVKSGARLGRLAGVPVGVKDIYNTRDMPTQMGSPIWKDFTPGNDARVVYSLRMADAVVAGKTTTAEFAVHAPAPTGNPHNPAYMPGTSSSGSAVGVAAYMVPIAMGTQTAGSTLRPASYCGIFGFKPSFGVIPRTGMLKTTDSLDTVGFFARTPDDLEILFDVLRVHGRDYPISEAAYSDETRQSKGPRPWRIALARGPKWNDAEHYAQQALLAFAKHVSNQPDIILTEIELSPSFSRAHDIHAIIYDKTLSYYFKEEFRQHTLISPIMYEIINRGNRITLETYQRALVEQSALSKEFDALMTQYDAILTLTTGGSAFKGLDSVDRPDSCLVWTLCGAPAVNLPVFQNDEGMPFGAQLVARRYNDILLLRLLRALREQNIIPSRTHPHPALADVEQ